MVPATGQAHLDDVEGDVVGLGELTQFGLVLECSALRGKGSTESEQDVHELGLVTDRAVALGRLTQVGGDPDEFGLGVAYVQARRLAPPDASDRGVASKAVLDLAKARRGQLVHVDLASTAHDQPR